MEATILTFKQIKVQLENQGKTSHMDLHHV